MTGIESATGLARGCRPDADKRVSQVDRPIQKLIDDMIETMQAAPGVGLAAPQVGVPLRLAVIDVDDVITVIVNPEIIKSSGDIELDEGCLSVPGFWGRLNRYERVSVKALDRNGKEVRIRDAEGLFAQALDPLLRHGLNHVAEGLQGPRTRQQEIAAHEMREAEIRVFGDQRIDLLQR